MLDISAVGLTGIMAIDTFLVFTTSNPERYLELYSVNTMEHAASFCLKGRARNEYSGIMSGIGDEGFRSEFVVGSLYKHPQRNLVIQPLQYMDYILFFDFDKDSYFAVHQVGSMSFDEEITDDPYIHFSDCVCSDRWFLVDHLDESNVVSYLVFNWNGECIARLIPDVFPHRLTYDERSQTLYGVNIRTDSVYKFDLSGLIP